MERKSDVDMEGAGKIAAVLVVMVILGVLSLVLAGIIYLNVQAWGQILGG